MPDPTVAYWPKRAVGEQTSRYHVMVEQDSRPLAIGWVARYRGRCYPAYWQAVLYRRDQPAALLFEVGGDVAVFGTRKEATASLLDAWQAENEEEREE